MVNEAFRQTVELEVIKVSSAERLKETNDRMLWRSYPPSKRKKKLLIANIPAL
jgi:hypothetical protein